MVGRFLYWLSSGWLNSNFPKPFDLVRFGLVIRQDELIWFVDPQFDNSKMFQNTRIRTRDGTTCEEYELRKEKMDVGMGIMLLK